MMSQTKAQTLFWMILFIIAILVIFNFRISGLQKSFSADCKQTYTNHSLCDCVAPVGDNLGNFSLLQNETKNNR